MAHGRRPKVKSRRTTTRNESCGEGGNESAEKPRLQTAVDTAVVRKPNFYLGPNKPKEAAIPDPSKFRDIKVSRPSLKPKTLKSLTDAFYQLSCMID